MTHDMRSIPLEAGSEENDDHDLTSLGGGTWEADADMGRVHAMSPGLERLLAIPLARWKAEAGLWAARVHPLDRAAALEARAKPGRSTVEYRFFAGDGHLLWLRESVRHANGRVRALVLNVTTERTLASRLQAQSALTNILASASSFEEAAPLVLRSTGEALGYELGAIWQLDAATDALVPFHVWSARPALEFEQATRSLSFARGEGLLGRVLASGRAEWLADVTKDDGYVRAKVASAEGFRAGIAAPIRRGDRTVAVLEFYLREDRVPDEGLIATLEAIGSQLALFHERVEATAHLREVSMRRGAILEAALDCLVTIDASGKVVEWNPAAVQTFGHTPEEALGREMAELIVPPELRDAHRHGLARHLASGETKVLGRRIELTAMAKDGRRFPVEVAIVRIPVPGRPLFTGHIRDISSAKQTREELEGVRRHLERILHSAGEGVYGVDAEGTTTFMNAAALRMLGIEEKDAVGRKLHSVIHHTHPDGRQYDAVDCPIYQAAHGGPAATVKDELFYRVDGTPFPVDYVTSPIHDGDRVVGAVTVFSEITERRRTEQALRQSESLYRLLAEHSSDLVTRASADGRILYASPAAKDLLGYEPEDLVGRHLQDLTHPADQEAVARLESALLSSSARQSLSLRCQRSDGTYAWLEVVARPLEGAGGEKESVASWRDIGARMRTEEAVRESRERLDLALRAASLGTWDLDLRADTSTRSPRHDEIFGYAEPQLAWGMSNFMARIAPEDRARVEAAFAEARRSGRLAFECRIERADGREAWIDMQGAVLFEDGEPARMIGVVADITDRMETNAALEAWGTRTSAILESISDAFFALDRSWRFTYLNRQAELLLGRSKEELLGRVLWNEYPDLPGTAFEAAYFKAMHEGASSQVEDYYPGHDAWYDAKIYPSPDGLSVYFQNVTQRKRVERDIRESGERLDLALKAAELGAWDLDILKDSSVRSPRHDEIFGYPTPRAEWSAKIFFDHVLPEDRPLVQAAFAEGFATGRLAFECRIRRADGALRWINVQGRVVYEAQTPVRMLGVVADATERRHAEEAIRESEFRYRFLADNARDMITRSSPDGRLQYVSPAVRQLLGYEPEELVGRVGLSLVHPEDIERIQRERDALAAAGDVRTLTLRYQKKDGAYVWLEAVVQSVRDEQGAVVELVASSRDVTDRRVAERALEERAAQLARISAELEYQRDLLRIITENAGSALFMMNANGFPLFMNEAAKGLTGYGSLDEIRARPLHDSVHFRKPDGSPYPMEECPIDRANAEIRPLKDQREMFCRKDGTLFPVEYNVAPIANGGAVIEVRDITARLASERELKARAETLAQLTEALQRSNKELDQFAYITSHDLKAPLRGIANLSRWIEEDVSAHLTAESREHLDLLRGRVARMESLIDAILEYSRVGRVRTKPEPVDVGALLHDVADLISPPPGFAVRGDGPLPSLVTERMRLHQVLMNLVGNAIKHHHDKEHGSVLVSAQDAGAFWRFRVKDNGPGISPRFHEKIFVIFQTLEPRDKVEGTGIGLALVKKIVESNGGSISVESDVGQGAVFEFTWPKHMTDGRQT